MDTSRRERYATDRRTVAAGRSVVLLAGQFWPHRPVILEPAHYGMAVRWWHSWKDGSGYLACVEC